MTSRQMGRRVSTIAAERRKRSARHDGTRQTTRQKETAMGAKERRQLLQLVICGSIFVLLVAAKLLLPDRMAQVNARISGAMEQNMDVQAVFSAVGRAFSGADDIDHAADKVYQAVFHPNEEVLETSVQVPVAQEASAINALREYRATQENAIEKNTSEAAADAEQAGEQTVEQAEASTLAYVLYSDQNLPEEVSMEQAILGFDYCTPVSGTLSSGFGYREHPVEGEMRFHYGIDLAADTGTEIGCFADGTVTAVGESSSYGKYCIVAHEGGYSTLYAHCARITASSGAAVQEGEKIAEVGETGIATGPHLHFELQSGGKYLNPIYYVSVL